MIRNAYRSLFCLFIVGALLCLSACANSKKTSSGNVEQEMARLEQEMGPQDLQPIEGQTIEITENVQQQPPAPAHRPVERRGQDTPPAQPVRIQRIDETTEVEVYSIDETPPHRRPAGKVTPHRSDTPVATVEVQPIVENAIEQPQDVMVVAPAPPAPVVESADVSAHVDQEKAAREDRELRRRQAKLSRDTAAFARRIESAHGIGAWKRGGALSVDIQIVFGGNVAVEGRFTFDTSLNRVRADMKDGTVVIYKDGEAWMWPANSQLQRARFHILTWPYFLAAPFKLRDPGSRLEAMQPAMFNGKPHPVARLTFGDGVGDSPDDWYIAYADPGTNWLRGMAYIVTFGKDTPASEAVPHAIMYDDFARINGVIIARRWSFWNWNLEQGIHSEPRGYGRLSNLRFVRVSPDWFNPPADAKVLAMP